MSYRVMWSPESSAAEKAAFQKWASEEYEWGQRWYEANERAKAYEHAVRVSLLRSSSQLRADVFQGNEDVTVATSSQKVKAA